MKILGVDHGTNYLGWAVMEKGVVTDFGIINYTKVKFPYVITEIFRDMLQKMKEVRPDKVIVEQPVHFRNASTARYLICAYASVINAAQWFNLPFVDVKPSELKAITGNGRAEKWDVAVAVQQKYGLDFDEIAIPVYYQQNDPKGKYKKGEVKERLYDPADAIALCWAFHNKTKRGA